MAKTPSGDQDPIRRSAMMFEYCCSDVPTRRCGELRLCNNEERTVALTKRFTAKMFPWIFQKIPAHSVAV
jgi:hypothetical protein